VAELVHTGDRAATTNQTVVVVAWIVGPGSAELRDCLTHRKASELDEGVVDTKRTAGNLATASSCRIISVVRGGAVAVADVATAGPGERRIEEGADNAILGRGARIDGEVFTRAPGVGIRETVVCATSTRRVARVDAVRIQ